MELLIYVFDIESRELEKDMNHFDGCLEAIEQNSESAKVFVLIHKMDLVPETQRDAVFEQRKDMILSRTGVTKYIDRIVVSLRIFSCLNFFPFPHINMFMMSPPPRSRFPQSVLGRPFGMKPSTEPGHLLSTH